MKKKLGFGLSLLLAASTLLGGCGTADKDDDKAAGDKNADFKVGIVTDVGGIDDKSFNQSAWEGLVKFGGDFDLTENTNYKYLQSKEQAEYVPNLSKFADANYNLTFGVGFLLEDPVQQVAEQNPDANFALIDSIITDKDFNPVKMDNVAAITFEEHQGSFLVGVVAAKHTKTNKVGFIGGVDSPLIKKFENGFKAGVKSVNPDIEIMVQYAESFNDAAKGTSIASTMYGQDVDVIYHASGGTGNGVFTEAKNRKKNGEDVWVIGVDKDQHEEGMPENVTLTSMVKRVDLAVYDVSKRTLEGNFPGGEEVVYGLEEDGVGIAPTTDNLTEDDTKLVDEYKGKILNGDIEVPKTDEEYETFLGSLK